MRRCSPPGRSRRAAQLQEELARLRAAAPGADEPLPVAAQLQEEFFPADVERALSTAEGFLQEGAQLRERFGGELQVAGPSEQQEGVAGEPVMMRIVVLLGCRTLGVLLVVGGAMVNYALGASTREASSVGCCVSAGPSPRWPGGARPPCGSSSP